MTSLKHWMEAKRLSCRQVAEGISDLLPEGETVSVPAVEKWKYGLRVPRKKYVNAIYQFTLGEVTPNDLIVVVEEAA